MSGTLARLDEQQVSEIAVTLRHAGIAGAGGAGFPTHAKWQRIDEVDALLVNHQESEPNYYMDKWLGQERAEDLGALFEGLLDTTLDLVVIAAKETDRDEWMGELEWFADGAIYGPDDLPLDPDDESGVVFAYTEDRYEFGMESVLLNMVADTVIGQDLPMDHGWIVQNTETLLNIYDALVDDEPMTRKLVHVGGKVTDHRFLEAPIGTPASALLEAAGMDADSLADDLLLADGGPGWCFEIEQPPDEFGLRKRSNCLLVVEEEVAEDHTLGNDRIDLRNHREWKQGDHEHAPTDALVPERVHIPLISNPNFEGLVATSEPVVQTEESIEAGEMIAVPSDDGISNAQHASITGEVVEVSDRWITIERTEAPGDGGRTATVEPTDRLYWTWCRECGTHVIPEGRVTDPTDYVCEDCR